MDIVDQMIQASPEEFERLVSEYKLTENKPTEEVKGGANNTLNGGDTLNAQAINRLFNLRQQKEMDLKINRLT